MSQGDPESLKMGYGRLDPITQSLTERQILNAIPPTERSIIATLRQQLAAAQAENERLRAEITVDEQRVADLMVDVDRVGKDNERLRAALLDVRNALQFANDTQWVFHHPETVLDFIDAALATGERARNALKGGGA